MTQGKGKNILHRTEDWRMLSAEDNWDTVQEETFVGFHTRVPRETVRQRGKKMEHLALSKHPLLY